MMREWQVVFLAGLALGWFLSSATRAWRWRKKR